MHTPSNQPHSGFPNRGCSLGAAFSDCPGSLSAGSVPLKMRTFRNKMLDWGCAVAADVTVTGNLITQIRPTAANRAPQPSQQVLDGTGKTLIPGLIDAHVHMMFAALAPQDAFTADESYIQIAAAANAKEMLLRGFTTVRDAGGPTFGLKRAIDEGIIAGPRIYPSGAFLSQSGAHGDFRLRNEVPRGARGYLGVAPLESGTDLFQTPSLRLFQISNLLSRSVSYWLAIATMRREQAKYLTPRNKFLTVQDTLTR
jgi:Amidohydrolase family